MSDAVVTTVSIGLKIVGGVLVLQGAFLAGGAAYGVSKILDGHVRWLRSNPEVRIDQARRRTMRDVRRRLSGVESRQRRYERMTQTLQSRLGSYERKTARRLQQQRDDLSARLNAQQNEFSDLLDAADRKFSVMMSEERKRRRRDVADLQSRLDALAAQEEKKREAAREIIADLRAIAREIERLPLQRFAPGRMDDIRRHIADAEIGMSASMAEAALSTAQDAYWRLADLRDEVLEAEQVFFRLRQEAIQRGRDLLATAQSARRRAMEIDPDTGEEMELDVDFWTGGGLARHEAELENQISELIDGEEILTIDDVRRWHEQLDATSGTTDELVQTAKAAVLASQIRFNLAQIALDVFETQGFRLYDSTYEGDDPRNAYVMKVRNIAGSEIVSVIAPFEGNFGENRLTLHAYDDAYSDETALDQRAGEIVAALNAEGVHASPPQPAGAADPRFRNIEVVRGRGTMV